MSSQIWTDKLGRSYPYTPHRAARIAGLELDLSNAATLAVATASRALGSVPSLPLAGIAAVLYRSESSASSLIEGLAPAPRRILEAEFAVASDVNDPVAVRVVQNLAGLRDALKIQWPARSSDYLRWHRLLTEGHPTLHPKDIGAYRTEQNWIGGDASGPRNATFIPPEPGNIEGLIADLEAFCARTDIAPVVQAAVAHAQFEVVHPFVDGNGRVGRMLFQHLLVRRLELSGPVPVSIPWSADTNRYLTGLRAYQGGDASAWLEHVGESIVLAVEWMQAAVTSIDALLGSFRAMAATRGASVAARIINDLPAHPLIDSKAVANRYDVTQQAAHEALARLEHRGVLEERAFARRTKRGRPPRVFSSPALLQVLGSLVRTPSAS